MSIFLLGFIVAELVWISLLLERIANALERKDE